MEVAVLDQLRVEEPLLLGPQHVRRALKAEARRVTVAAGPAHPPAGHVLDRALLVLGAGPQHLGVVGDLLRRKARDRLNRGVSLSLAAAQRDAPEPGAKVSRSPVPRRSGAEGLMAPSDLGHDAPAERTVEVVADVHRPPGTPRPRPDARPDGTGARMQLIDQRQQDVFDAGRPQTPAMLAAIPRLSGVRADEEPGQGERSRHERAAPDDPGPLFAPFGAPLGEYLYIGFERPSLHVVAGFAPGGRLIGLERDVVKRRPVDALFALVGINTRRPDPAAAGVAERSCLS